MIMYKFEIVILDNKTNAHKAALTLWNKGLITTLQMWKIVIPEIKE